MREGWQTKRLGDFAAAVSTGPFGSILHKSDYVDDGVPLVNPTNIVGESIVPDPSKLISEVTIKQLSNYVLEEGDIVVGRRGEIGRCAVVGPSESGWVCGTGSFFIRPLPSLDSQFLAHLIRSPEYREQLEKLSTGATMKNLSNTALGDLFVSVPPLAEQQRIVALLDEAFAGLATAKANAERNLQNARAIFESHLQSVFSQRGEGWVERRIEEWCYSVMDCVNKTAPVVEGPTPYKMIRTTNVRNGRVDVSNVRFVTEEIYKVWTRRQVPQWGDVILTREAPMGEVGMLLTNDKVFLGQRLVSYRVNSAKLDNQFLLFALQSCDLQSQIHAKASGSTVQHMRVPDTKSLLLAAPPLATQRQVVEHLVSLREETQRLTRLYERKLAALEELKKSLLHQAFNGEL